MTLDQAMHQPTTWADAETTASRPRNSFEPAVVARLLDKLSSDDGFRARFVINPREALRECGHVTPEHLRDIRNEDPVLCCYNLKHGTLPSKEAILGARKRLTEFFTGSLPLGIFGLTHDGDHR